MNHPKKEEWIEYLENAIGTEHRQRLSEHLEGCLECAAQVAGWQRTIRLLRGLAWPMRRPTSRFGWVDGSLKWGLAAALVMCTGFVLGQVSAQRPTRLDPAMVATLRNQLRGELKAEERRMRETIVQEVQAGRTEDRQTIFALLDDFQRERQMDYVSLRRDLETLASTADAGLNRTRLQLNQLAINTKP